MSDWLEQTVDHNPQDESWLPTDWTNANMPHDLDSIARALGQLIKRIDDLTAEMREPPKDGKQGGMLYRIILLEAQLKELKDSRITLKLVVLNMLTAILGGSITAYIAMHLVK